METTLGIPGVSSGAIEERPQSYFGTRRYNHLVHEIRYSISEDSETSSFTEVTTNMSRAPTGNSALLRTSDVSVASTVTVFFSFVAAFEPLARKM